MLSNLNQLNLKFCLIHVLENALVVDSHKFSSKRLILVGIKCLYSHLADIDFKTTDENKNN